MTKSVVDGTDPDMTDAHENITLSVLKYSVAFLRHQSFEILRYAVTETSYSPRARVSGAGSQQWAQAQARGEGMRGGRLPDP